MIGMTSIVNRTASYNPKFHIRNSSSQTALEVYITTPTLNFGKTSVKLEVKTITGAGGIITGTLTTSMVSISTNVTCFLVLPKNRKCF